MTTYEFQMTWDGESDAQDFAKYENVSDWWAATPYGCDMINLCFHAPKTYSDWSRLADDLSAVYGPDADIARYCAVAHAAHDKRAIAACGLIAAIVSGGMGARNVHVADLVRKYVTCPY